MELFELQGLIKIIYSIECLKGQEIINNANPIMFFFIVHYGKFHVFHEENGFIENTELKEGSIFGENSIIQNQKFNGYVRCIEDSKIYALNKKDYQLYLKTLNEIRLKDKIEHLKNSDIISKYI